MRRNYWVNSLFLTVFLALFLLVKFTGYFSATYYMDDFFNGAIIIPINVILALFGLSYVVLWLKNNKKDATGYISLVTTAGLFVALLFISRFYLLLATSSQILIFGSFIAIILANVWFVEYKLYIQKKAQWYSKNHSCA